MVEKHTFFILIRIHGVCNGFTTWDRGSLPPENPLFTVKRYPREEKGGSPHLCAAPFGPFRQMGTVPFFPLVVQ